MQKQFIPYELALELKELGFDEKCVAYYKSNILKEKGWDYTESQSKVNYIFGVNNDAILAPLYQQAFRWLYQKLDIEKGVIPLDTESQQLLLKELIDKVSSKYLLV